MAFAGAPQPCPLHSYFKVKPLKMEAYQWNEHLAAHEVGNQAEPRPPGFDGNARWIVETAKKVYETLRLQTSLSPEEEIEKDLLNRQIIALEYRTGLQANVIDGPGQLYDTFAPIVERYKNHPELSPQRGVPLTAQEILKLRDICQNYPHFVMSLIARNTKPDSFDSWTAAFVKWSILAGSNPRVLIEYPNEAAIVMKNLVYVHEGLSSKGNGLQIQAIGGFKQVAMKVNGGMVPILGQIKRMPVHQNQSLDGRSPELLMSQVKATSRVYSDVEWTYSRGLIKWPAYGGPETRDEWGDLNDAGWHNRLPDFIVATRDELRERYPNQVLSGIEEGGRVCGFAVCASSSHNGMQVWGNHGYIEFVYPDPNTPDLFRILNVGFQPKDLPETMSEYMLSLGDTREAGIHIPDNSAYRIDRKHLRRFHNLSENDEFAKAMAELRRWIRKGQNGQLFFQPLTNNCDHRMQRMFDFLFLKPMILQPLIDLADKKLGIETKVTKASLKQAIEGFDDNLLLEVLQPLIQKLIEDGDRRNVTMLLNNCSEFLNRTLLKDEQAKLVSNLTAEQLPDLNDELGQQLLQLIKGAIDDTRFYKTFATECEYMGSSVTALAQEIPTIIREFFIVKYTILAIRTFVEALIHGFVFLCLCSWRSHTFEVPGEDGQMVTKTRRLYSNPLWANSTTNLPNHFWIWDNSRPQMVEQMRQLQGQFIAGSNVEPA